MREDMRVLRLCGVGVDAGSRRLFRDLSVEFHRGRAAAVVGPSGSGKTTLLGVIGGHVRCAGAVRLVGASGERSVEPDDISWIHQRGVGVPGRSAWEVAGLPLLLQGESMEQVRLHSTEVFERLGIGQILDQRYRSLSGGERQRVAVAQALLSRRELILADEPTAALDRAFGIAVADALVVAAQDRIVIIATHDPQVAARCGARLELG